MADQGQGQTTPAPGAGGRGAPRPGDGRADDDARAMPRAGGPVPPTPPVPPDTLMGTPEWADAHSPAEGGWDEEADEEADEDDDSPAGDAREGLGSGVAGHELQWRVRARQQMREFLRAVPRREERVTLTIMRADGSLRTFTRGALTAAIDRLRPRQRQIVRLSIEERWSRQSVCDYLRHISMKTFERDQVEALDRLLDL